MKSRAVGSACVDKTSRSGRAMPIWEQMSRASSCDVIGSTPHASHHNDRTVLMRELVFRGTG